MGKDFYNGYSSVRRLFETASELLKKDLKTLCFEGPEFSLVQTDQVQPAVTLVNLACLEVLREEGVMPSAAAGHSLGEYSALCAAGVFAFEDVMRLVQCRSTLMRAAAERHPGAMTAIFGLDVETLVSICAEIREAGSVEVANHNSPSQTVLTGDKEALQKAAEIAKKKGAKITMPLRVSGAWHSRSMAEVQAKIQPSLESCAIRPPSFPVMSNVTAEAYPDQPETIRARLVEQIVRPVQWSASIDRLIRDGHRLFVEVGPGKVLSGLMKDISREVKILNVQDLVTLEKLRLFRQQPNSA
jgi:[acyl-carrier-protein] S-malonyltransferase